MPQPPPHARQPLILVALEDRLSRSLARVAFAERGLRIAEAPNADETLLHLARHPAVVVFDAVLEAADGRRLLDLLGGLPPAERPGLLVATPPPELVDSLPEDADWVDAPLDWQAVLRRVERILRRQRAHHQLHRAQRLARIGSFAWDPASDALDASEEAHRMLGREARALDRAAFLAAVDERDRDALAARWEEASQLGKPFAHEVRVTRSDGSTRYLRVQLDPQPAGPLGTIQDVTEQMRSLESVRYLANYDSLTGLLNRHQFLERLEHAMAAAVADGKQLALLYVDLDQFKQINDTLGHSAGDELLRQVSDRLRRQVRASDTIARIEPREGETEVSRLGGDEFTVLLSRVGAGEEATEVAKRILRALTAPIQVGHQEVSVTCSVGIAVCPQDGTDVDGLMRRADQAMYHAKELGRDNFQFYDESMNAASARRFELASALRTALEEKTLRLHYQPRLDLASGRIRSAEALLRFEHEELGRVSPTELIPVAEESGLIIDVSSWALEQACADARAWRERELGIERVSVNVSPVHFRREDLRDWVGRILRASQLDPAHLELELTESSLLQDNEEIALVLRDLRAMGVRIALDDFGTGYSSLSYLTRFPIDTLKLDRALVRDAHTDPGAAGIVRAVIALGHSIGNLVVAEGVECEEQLTILRELGCDEIQGFHLSAALPDEALVEFVRER